MSEYNAGPLQEFIFATIGKNPIISQQQIHFIQIQCTVSGYMHNMYHCAD